MFGTKKKTIAEQAERIRALEQQAQTLSDDNQRMKERMDDVERRERGIGRTATQTRTKGDLLAETDTHVAHTWEGLAHTQISTDNKVVLRRTVHR